MLVANIKLLKSLEGFSPTAYKDTNGKWAVGYGYTLGVKKGDIITEQKAADILSMHISIKIEPQIKSAVAGLGLTQNQIDALSLLSYNIGIYAFLSSTLLREIKRKATKDLIEFQ